MLKTLLVTSRKIFFASLLTRPKENSWIWWYGALNTHECSCVLMSHTPDNSWALTRAHECFWRYGIMGMSAQGSSWLLFAAHICSCVRMSRHDHPWALLVPEVIISTALMSNYEYGALSTHAPHYTIAPYFWVLIIVLDSTIKMFKKYQNVPS